MSPIYVQRKLKIGSEDNIEALSDNQIKKLKRTNPNRKIKLLLVLFLGIFLSVLTVGFYTLVLPAQRIYTSVQSISGSAKALASDLESKQLASVDEHFTDIQVELANVNEELDQYEFLDDWSVTKGYYENLQVVRKLSDKSQSFLDKTLPEFKIVLSSLGYSTEDIDAALEVAAKPKKKAQKDAQLSQIVKELPRLIKFYDEIEPDVIELIDIFNELDADYVPNVGSYDFGNKVASVQKLTQNFDETSAEVKNTLANLPDLLGAKKKVRYLVVLQNEKELRAAGGLYSAYGVVTVKNGEVIGDIDFTDSWQLNNYVFSVSYGPGYFNEYGQKALMLRGCGSDTQRAQDSGDTPDLYNAMSKFTDYYDIANQYNPTEFPDYDHVVLFNTFFISDIVSFVDPIVIENGRGGKVSINQKNIAEKIFSVTSTAFFDPSSRKSFIGEVGSEVMKRVKNLKSKEFPEVLAKFISTAQAKNIALYSKNESVQAYFDELGLSARVVEKFKGDYFSLSEAQNCALKSNFYITDTVTQDIFIERGGVIRKEVNIRWENDTVYNPNRHNNVLTQNERHLYRAWVRILAPVNTEFTYSDGYEKSRFAYYTPQSYLSDEFNKQVSDNVIWYDYRRNTEADPPTNYELNVEYDLPPGINYAKQGVYRMLIQKHPGKRNELYKINIHHKDNVTTKEIKLDRDKIITYREGAITIENYDKTLDRYSEFLTNLPS